MTWSIETSVGGEAMKMLWELPQYTRGRGLDVGCGAWKAFPHFIGVDNYTDQAMFGTMMKPDVVANADDLTLFADESMDFVFSSHLLEHLEDTEKTLREWWRTLKVGGHLCLYLPHKLFYPNIGEKGANSDHKHDFMPHEIVDIMKRVGSWDLLRNEDRNDKDEYSFFQVYKKL